MASASEKPILDGDGVNDLAIPAGSFVRMLLGLTAGDFNGDGRTRRRSRERRAGDGDGDGTFGAPSVFVFLNHCRR